jgi:starch-binding outer membrane protein, SusD/RagB family
MKRYQYIFIPLTVCCLVLTSCDKYLDIKPKGKTLLSTITDYDQWLNDPQLLVTGVGTPVAYNNYYGDNYDYPGIATPPANIGELMYTWAPQISTDISAAPLFWGDHYAKINNYNTVILGIDQATGGTQDQKNSLKAEALLGRALEYFYLVNEYGKPYDSATAAQDPGVPFVTSNSVTQQVPPRSSVADVHQRIIDDINAALPDLPDNNSANRMRGSKAAAYSVLARIYLYARNYTDARKNAELALTSGYATMIDLNGTLPTSDVLGTQPDVIYGRVVLGSATPTLEFMRTFASNDLRVRKFYRSSDNYAFTVRGATTYIPSVLTPVFKYLNTGTSVQEMKLIIAECAARSNDLAVALQQLDEVKKTRVASATYVRFQSTDPEAVLQEVLKERNRELPFCGLRWFDMRRLDKENRMPAVKRYNAQGGVIATLEPHSTRYTWQIPVQALAFNPGMEQNP